MDLLRRDCLLAMGDISVSNPSKVLRSLDDSSKTLSDSESELLKSPNFNVFGLYIVPDLVWQGLNESLGVNWMTGVDSMSLLVMKSSFLLTKEFLWRLSLSRNLFCPRAMFTTSFVKSQFVHVCTSRQHRDNWVFVAGRSPRSRGPRAGAALAATIGSLIMCTWHQRPGSRPGPSEVTSRLAGVRNNVFIIKWFRCMLSTKVKDISSSHAVNFY